MQIHCALSPFFTVRLARLDASRDAPTLKLFRLGACASAGDALRFYFGCEADGRRDATQVRGHKRRCRAEECKLVLRLERGIATHYRPFFKTRNVFKRLNHH